MNQERLTCRDQNGLSRLTPGANLMDVIDLLCELEEAKYGKMVIPSAGAVSPSAKRCRHCNNYRPITKGTGLCMKFPARDKHGNISGPHRMVQAARFACPKGFEPKTEE